MGCSASHTSSIISAKKKAQIKRTPFPLSFYQKTIIKDVWSNVRDHSVEMGLKTFYYLFKSHPELIMVFPEFADLKNIEEILSWKKLHGHPYKIFTAMDRAVNSLDDGDIFILHMERLGEKHHENNLQPEYLNALGEAIVQSLKDILGKQIWTDEVEKSWREMYVFICKLMKQGLLKASSNRTIIGVSKT